MTAAVYAAAVEVHIFHTSDLHAGLNDFAKLAGVIAARRNAVGAERSIYIDTGDTVQGTLAGVVSRGAAALEVLRAAGCEVWVPGNHEFDFGVPRFIELAESMRATLLCGNLHPKDAARRPYPAWKIFERGGARIAVIGAAPSYLPNWFLDDFDAAFEAGTAKALLQRVLPEILAQQPDAIILAAHQGWLGQNQDQRGVNEIAELAQIFPEIDLFLGAHTHRIFAGQAIGPHGWYIQPGANAEFAGEVTLFCDTDRHQVVRIESRLLQPDKESPAAPPARAAELVKNWQRAVSEFSAAQAIPPLPSAISAKGRPGEDNAMSEVISAAITAAAGADCALHGVLSKTGLPAGAPITGKELFAVIPYENTVVTCEVTAAELARIIAEQWQQRKVYTYCGLYGATARINADGTAAVLSVNGKPAEPERRYRLALNSFTAAGGGRVPVLTQILAQPEAKLFNTGINTRDALRSFLSTTPPDANFQPARCLIKQ